MTLGVPAAISVNQRMTIHSLYCYNTPHKILAAGWIFVQHDAGKGQADDWLDDGTGLPLFRDPLAILICGIDAHARQYRFFISPGEARVLLPTHGML